MKPYIHAQNTARRYGGKPEDYLVIHDFLDSSKMCHPDMRHRALLHNSFGCYVAERVFGTFIVNSDGVKIQVRDVAEGHIIDDMGRIPTVSEYLDGMPYYEWLGGRKKERRTTSLDEIAPDKPPTEDDLKAQFEEALRRAEESHRANRLPSGLPPFIID